MKIVISELNWPCGTELLRSQGWRVVYDPDLWKDRIRLRAELEDADALIVRNQTQVDKELIGWPHRLRVIGRLGVGLDNLDLEVLAGRGIPIVFGKNANATSVAEYVISCLFSFSRLLHEASGDVKQGGWNRKRFTGMELAGTTLGLIGTGEIGHRVARRAIALGMDVIGFDPYVTPYDFPLTETGIRLVEFDRLLATSDFISLHVPLTPKTRNLLGKEAFAKMKNGLRIINSSRGGIIDEFALYDALESGLLGGAALDVLTDEPPKPDHPLLHCERCILTPHIAGLTEQSQERTSELVAREVIAELEGRVSLCRVTARG
jgi:D-3-phosphoglycerate dehydrogenase/(S)-sulfolactate dehydrogenase